MQLNFHLNFIASQKKSIEVSYFPLKYIFARKLLTNTFSRSVTNNCFHLRQKLTINLMLVDYLWYFLRRVRNSFFSQKNKHLHHYPALLKRLPIISNLMFYVHSKWKFCVFFLLLVFKKVFFIFFIVFFLNIFLQLFDTNLFVKTKTSRIIWIRFKIILIKIII